MHRIGTHCLIELSGCDAGLLDDPVACERAVRDAAAAGGLDVLRLATHRFEPQGVTAFALLSESHLAVHTWPEHGHAAADLFTCGDRGAIDAVVGVLRRAFGAEHVSHREVERVTRVMPVKPRSV